jgi:BirA family biotin operon repressor/biotin-[acetyl-CoA-carboxylase] ligase
VTEHEGEDRVLLALLSDGGFHSGESLAAELGISRAAVWKRIGRLGELGLHVERRSGRGYRLEGGIELLEGERILALLPDELRARVTGVDVCGVIDSTNDVLLRALRSGKAVHGVACLAERQTSGRGRRGRNWLSPFGSNIYLSLAWRFDRGVAALDGLSLAVGVAVVRALEQCGIGGIGLKWPNDLFAGDAKFGGILIELDGELSGPMSAVIGVGLNLRMPLAEAAAIGQPWIDLETLAGRVIGRNALAAALIASCVELLPRFAVHGFSVVQPDWERLDVLAGRGITVSTSDGRVLDGTADGVDAGGALRLRSAEGLLLLNSGEVSVRRRA